MSVLTNVVRPLPEAPVGQSCHIDRAGRQSAREGKSDKERWEAIRAQHQELLRRDASGV